jgi:proline iminopeptidase
MKDPVSWLYPPIEPYNTGRLQVSPVHEIYFEESGNPSSKPVVFLHGGPGGGSDPKQRRFFHPEKYRIVNFDQRGCGKRPSPNTDVGCINISRAASRLPSV